jgi:hypothetical protein
MRRSQCVGEFEGLVQPISPENLSSTSHCLKAAAYYSIYTVLIMCRSQRVGEFEGLVQLISPENLSSTSHYLKAAAYYIHGIDHV